VIPLHHMNCSRCGVDFDPIQRKAELGNKTNRARPIRRCRDCYEPQGAPIKDKAAKNARQKLLNRARKGQPITPIKEALAAQFVALEEEDDHVVSQRLLRNLIVHMGSVYTMLAPRDVAQAARQIAQVMDVQRGGEAIKNPYSTVELVLNIGTDDDDANAKGKK